MNAPVSSLWTTQQQAWLRALGHTVWRYGNALSVLAALPKPPSSTPTEVATSTQVATEHEPPTSKVLQAAENVPQAPALLSTSVPNPLLLALIRAGRFNPNQEPIRSLMAQWPLDELRGNPAAKRAFWPQLRALRRQYAQHMPS